MKYIVTRNNPVSTSLNSFNSMFDSIFGDWGMESSRIPSVDVHETENAYVLEAELPGFKEEDVNVQVEKHVLHLSSVEKQDKEEKQDKKYLIRERYRRSFDRYFSLPEGIKEDAITGEFANGVLTVTMPKTPVEAPKKICVKMIGSK
jgi:HSP20 family molecular chaperone IbpA